MRVKIGKSIYDAGDQPIMVIFSKEDLHNVKHMAPGKYRYVNYPDTMHPDQVQAWIEEDLTCDETHATPVEDPPTG